jgi:hypothetical protein
MTHMSKKLLDFLPEPGPEEAADTAPTTPQTTAWTKGRQTGEQRWRPYTNKDLYGLSLCYQGIDDAIRKYPRFVPKELVISSRLRPEVESDHLARYHRPYNGYIPYSFGPDAKPLWIHVTISQGTERDTIFVSE